MAALHLRVAPLQNPERYESLAQALAGLAGALLGQDPATLAVTIDDLPAARCWIGGQVPQRPTAQLEVSLAEGAASQAQKAGFVAAAHAELARQLALGEGLQEPSYVIVRELPAADWGWGGQTQAQRAAAQPRAEPVDLAQPRRSAVAELVRFRTAGRR